MDARLEGLVDDADNVGCQEQYPGIVFQLAKKNYVLSIGGVLGVPIYEGSLAYQIPLHSCAYCHRS